MTFCTLYDEYFSQEGELDQTGRGASPQEHLSVQEQFTQQSINESQGQSQVTFQREL